MNSLKKLVSAKIAGNLLLISFAALALLALRLAVEK
jgi:hypothetical protein